MKGSIYMFLILLSSLTGKLHAQLSFEQHYIGTGAVGSYDSVEVSWSVGEPVVFTTEGNFLTQGFQQDFLQACQQFNISSNQISFCDSTPLLLSAKSGLQKYQWFFNGNKIVGQTSETYKPVLPGAYTVDYTEINGCQGASFAYNVDLKSGLHTPVISGTDTMLTSSLAKTYQWYIGKRAIVGANAESYQPLFRGEYYVNVSFNKNCSMISNPYEVTDSKFPEFSRMNFLMTDSTVVIPSDYKEGENILVYPNPNKGDFNVQFFKRSANSTAALYNSVGEIVDSRQINDVDGFVNIKYQLEGDFEGFYLLKIYDGSSTYCKKVILE